MKQLANLIQTLTQETIDFHRYLDDYQIDVNEELVLTAIRYSQQLIDELNELTFEDYTYVIQVVCDDAANAIYGCEELDY